MSDLIWVRGKDLQIGDVVHDLEADMGSCSPEPRHPPRRGNWDHGKGQDPRVSEITPWGLARRVTLCYDNGEKQAAGRDTGYWWGIARVGVSAGATKLDPGRFPHVCPSCGARAYVGLMAVEHEDPKRSCRG